MDEERTFSVDLTASDEFAIGDATTCLWMIQSGRVGLALEMYGSYSEAEMQQAHDASERVHRAFRASKLYAQIISKLKPPRD